MKKLLNYILYLSCLMRVKLKNLKLKIIILILFPKITKYFMNFFVYSILGVPFVPFIENPLERIKILITIIVKLGTLILRYYLLKKK